MGMTLMKRLTLIPPLFGWFHPHTIGMGCVLDLLRGYQEHFVPIFSTLLLLRVHNIALCRYYKKVLRFPILARWVFVLDVRSERRTFNIGTLV